MDAHGFRRAGTVCEHALIPGRLRPQGSDPRDPDTTTCDHTNIEVISVHDFSVPTTDDAVTAS